MLFPNRRHKGVRVVVTGQVGVEKKPFLDRVAEIASSKGKELTLFHVGDRMYVEAPDVRPGRILDLPKKRLDSLRRSVFKDGLALAEKVENLVVNTHATFRWRHGLFHAYDHDQMQALAADLYVTLVDNVDAVHERLLRQHDIPHTLKDILVWREEEIVVTATIAEAIQGYGSHYIISRGEKEEMAALMMYRLMFEPHRKRVYPSFPMTHVLDMPDTLAEINAFRTALADYFITFDPGDLDEKRLLFDAGAATQRGELTFPIRVNGRELTLRASDVTQVAADIDGQIYARDFKLIDQSDMIVSFIPAMPNGKPALSSGVERELQHAFEGTKEVYVVWKPEVEPSPFVTQTATRVFPAVDDLMNFFHAKGYIKEYAPMLLKS
ncbi:MAG: hypothetical protein IT449_17215 [Phycisphaerales bacterium]|nr:hypothetical protein [Phycisphaerales bacterium]